MNFQKCDPSYLFMRGVQMLRNREVDAAREIGDLIDHADENIRRLAQFFIYRASIDFCVPSEQVSVFAKAATV
jgi:hypothetical protein